MPGSLVGVVLTASREGVPLLTDPLAPLLMLAVAAAATPVLVRAIGARAFHLAALAPLAVLVWAAANWSAVVDGHGPSGSVEWVPALGLTLGLRLDGLSVLMVGLVAGVGAMVLTYAGSYFDQDDHDDQDDRALGRFGTTMLLFAAAMVGLVMAEDLFSLFLFWELTSVASYLLIGTDDRRSAARSGARQALLITGMGGLAMLGGFIVLGQESGTWSLAVLLSDPPSGRAVDVALLLVLVGALTKSAQAPFHSWLPRAMAAPTPVSAFLHSATMVTAGVYLIARFSGPFSESVVWRPAVICAGGASMLIGGYRALRQHDLKALLAYGTVSQLGLMTLLFGVGTTAAAAAGCLLLLAHGVFKAALFMVVGIVDHQTHTRDIRHLEGLGRRWPLLCATAALAAASMAGIPPLIGFVAKESALTAIGEVHAGWGPWLLAAVVVGAALTVAYSARFVWGAFGPVEGSQRPEAVIDRAPTPSIRFAAPAVALAALGLLSGLVPTSLESLVDTATESLRLGDPAVHLALWHGPTTALVLSALAICTGALLFVERRRIERAQSRAPRFASAQGAYDAIVKGVLEVADVVTAAVQHGSLPVYLGVILLTVVVGPLVPLAGGFELPDLVAAQSPVQVVIAVVMITAAIAVTRARRRIDAVLFVGAVGYGMAAMFVVQGAPDLAITQLLIETLGVAVFVLVFRHLPDEFRPSPVRIPRVFVAVAAAVFAFVLTLAATGARSEQPISTEYLSRAASDAGADNVVNAIVVDFRGFDTLGEITVLVVASLGVAALVRVRTDPS